VTHRDPTIRICAAIIGIVILESIAMIMGHNGTLLRLALIAVAGLGGWSLGQFLGERPHRGRDPLSDDFLNRPR
jgi:hypothetical protein